MDRKRLFLLTLLLLSIFGIFVPGYFICLLFIDTDPNRERNMSNKVSKNYNLFSVQKKKFDECVFYLRRMEQNQHNLSAILSMKQN